MTIATKLLQTTLRCVLGCMVLGAGFSAHAFVLGPTTPGKWGSPVFGTGAVITYSYMPTGVSCAAEAVGCTISHLGDFIARGLFDIHYCGL